VPRGSTLLPQLNDALAAAKADGTVARLIEQYLDIAPEDQAPIPTPAPTPATAPTATPATAVTPAPARCDPYTGYGNPLDLSVPDDTPMQPGQAFDKRWRIVNAGTCDWTAGYAFVYANKGERMGGQDAPIKVAVPVGGSLDISVPMLAPTAPGTHYGYWQMADANGKPFGKQVSVKIVVVAPPPPPTQPPPTNISWKVDRDRIKQGESANFTLNVTGARNVWFNEKGQPYVGVNGQSTQRVTPSRDTTYQLRVEQSDGRYWEDYKTIYVTQAVSRPEIVEFGINPQYETVIGQPVTLWWKVRGVVDGISLLRNGAQLNQTTAVESAWEDSPPAGDWTYELQAWGPGGSASPAYQQIRVKREPEQPPPDITRFDSNPQGSVLQGQCVELSWDIQGGWDGMELTVNGGTLTGGAGPSTYQDCQCPQNTGVCNYELRVWNQSGSDNAGLSLEVVMQTLPGNPAATFCQDNGGQYNGDQNTCTLPDGTVCDAWAYANGECPAPQ
jgi:putative hemolysin